MENLLRAKSLWSVVEINFSEGTMLTKAQRGHLVDARLKDHQVTVECYRCHDLSHFQYKCP